MAFATLKQGLPADASAALERAAAFSLLAETPPPPRTNHNLLVFVEVGRGPEKFRAGRYGEQLRFRELPSAIRQVEIRRAGRIAAEATVAEDLYQQATTRGTRQVDYILQGKASFKEGTETAAVALGIGAVMASEHNDVATGVLGGLAVLSAVASAAATPEADIRTWDNLPHSIYLLSLELPPGTQVFEVVGLSASAQRIDGLTVTVNVEPDDPVGVVFVKL